MEPSQFPGKTVDEATELALETLGVNLEDIEISVVRLPRLGILGFGGQPALIEVRLVGEAADAGAEEDDEPKPDAPEETAPRGSSRSQGRGPQRRRGRRDHEQGASASSASVEIQGVSSSTTIEELPGALPAPRSDFRPRDANDYEELQPSLTERDTEAEALVGELLDYFLNSMGVVAATYVRDELVNDAIAFDIEGEDAGLLIGRRGETLQALQFIVSMIVNRQLGRKCYVLIDVEGYRERSDERLQALARRAASTVASSGDPAPLEPMSPSERRIIHLELASHPRVRTESEGQGGRRRVVIHPRD